MPKPAVKSLRAVGYCRTSGEGQRDNTSIPRQKDAIKAMCKANGWHFVRFYIDECKSGSSIAGRDEFQMMLADAKAGKFDLIVPFDVTRFARDGADIISQSKSLKSDLGIFVVDAKGQFDSRSYRNSLQNFVLAGVSEHERLVIMERMIGGKVRRAQHDNIPTSGRLPFGRTFDRQTNTWGIDKEKQSLIRQIAEQYVAGESLEKLAAESPLSYSQIWKILKRGCGDTWTLRYRVDDLELDETVSHEIPRLLPEKLVKAAHQRMEENRTILHGRPTTKNKYLLQGRIFCAACGGLMTGAARPSGLRLYRHNPRNKTCPLHPRPAVRADLIESAVVDSLFDALGNQAAIERAIESAIPAAHEKIKRRNRANAELCKIEKGRERLINLIAEDRIADIHAKPQLDKLNAKEREVRAELDELDIPPCEDTPDSIKQPRLYVERTDDGDIFVHDDDGNTYAGGNDVGSFLLMTAEDRRKLIDAAFSVRIGKNPSGVYLTPSKGAMKSKSRARKFSYAVRGGVVIDGVTQFLSCDRRRSIPR